MNEQRREEIAKIVEHFRGKPINQNVLTEFCNKNKIEPIVIGDFQDFLYQTEHDEKVGKIYPLILAEVQKLVYIPEFASEAERKRMAKENDDVRVRITQIFEEHAIAYRTVDTLGQELGRDVGQVIASAGQTAFNKALEVLLLLAHERFGGDFNMKHAADFAKEYIEKKKDNK